MADRRVILYWAPTRQSCHAAKEFPSSHGIAYADRNIADDAAARDELVARTSRTAVPRASLKGTGP